MRSMSAFRPLVLLLATAAFACDEGTPPDMSGIDVPPAVDVPDRDPGRDPGPWDPGVLDPGTDPGVDAHPPDADDVVGPPDVLEGPGRVEAIPGTVDFGPVMRTGSKDRTLTLVNVGETDVSILSVAWADGSDPDFQVLPKPGFGPLDQPPTPALLAPGASVALTIRFAPPLEASGGQNTNATLRVATDAAQAPQVDVPCLAARIPRQGCDLRVSPQFPMAFGDVPAGATADASLLLRNAGPVQCTVDTLVLRGCLDANTCRMEDGASTVFAWVDSPSLPMYIDPGENRTLTVRFPGHGATPPVGTTQNAFLSVLHQVEGYGLPEPIDGFVPESCGPYGTCPANVFGRVVAAALDADPDRVAFGEVRVGCASDLVPVAVENVSASPVTIRSVQVDPACPTAGDVAVTGAPAAMTDLGPGQAFVLKLTWTPSVQGAFACDLLIRTGADAPGRDVRLPVSGIAAPGGTVVQNFRLPSTDVDVLFVADGSGSMMDGISKLADALPTFLSATQTAGRSARMGVIGVSAESGCADSGRLMGPVRLMTADQAYAFDDALSAVQLSSCPGNMDEQGLEAAQWALSPPLIDDTGTSCAGGGTCPVPYGCFDGVCGGSNRGLLRPDAGLDIVFFSDEEDQSPDTVDDYVAFFRDVLGADRAPGVRAFAIVGPAPAGCDNEHDVAGPGARYEAVTAALGGRSFPICVAALDDALSAVATPPWDRPIVLPLDAPPAPGTLILSRDDLPCTGGFDVDPQGRSLTVLPEGACDAGPGTRYRVTYETVCE